LIINDNYFYLGGIVFCGGAGVCLLRFWVCA